MAKTAATEAKNLIDSLIPDHLINSQRTFDEVTASPREVAGLYFYQQLDMLIDLTRAVSSDFFARPHLYTDLGDPNLASDLARLHVRYGCDEKLMSREQRQQIYEGIFTAGDEQFAGGRDALLRAAAIFSERVYDTGEDMLRAAVRDAARRFKAYLLTLAGVSLSWSRNSALPGLTDLTGYRILRARGVRAVFSLPSAVDQEWPWQMDGEGDKLVEAASKQLGEPAEQPLTRGRFNDLQRLALRGAEAIATIIDYDDQSDRNLVDHLILKCYTWHAALVRVVGPPSWVNLDGNRPLSDAASFLSA